MRRVPVMLLRELPLLHFVWVVGSCVALLIAWQRGRGRSGSAIPVLPVRVPTCPIRSPHAIPAWRCTYGPTAEDHWWIAVITHGNAQYEKRHAVVADKIPRSVVPRAGIPFVVHVDPIQAIVEEVIGVEARCVIHRIAGNSLQDGILDDVDGNIDACSREVRHKIQCRYHEYRE